MSEEGVHEKLGQLLKGQELLQRQVDKIDAKVDQITLTCMKRYAEINRIDARATSNKTKIEDHLKDESNQELSLSNKVKMTLPFAELILRYATQLFEPIIKALFP